MAHDAQRIFFEKVKELYPDHFRWSNVIEIGSLDINGSVRDMFELCNYVGFDVGPGPGVDYAIPGQMVRYPGESFDVAISAECFEHNPYWEDTFLNMVRMTKWGGLVTFTCAGKDRPEHGTARSDVGSSPLTVGLGWDYYRNLEAKDFEPVLKNIGIDGHFYENHVNQDLYYWGIKGEDTKFFDFAEIPWV